MDLRIAGAGISGIATAYFARNKCNIKISEKLNQREWADYFNRSVVMKHDHLVKIETRIPKMGKIIRDSSKKIFKVIKVFPTGKVFEFFSEKPIFHVLFLYKGSGRGFMGKIIKMDSIKINFNDEKISEESDVWAAGSPAGNIVGYGCFIQSNLDEIVLYYNYKYSPFGYTYISPDINKGTAILTSVCFDGIDYIKKNYTELLEKLLDDKNLKKWTGNPLSRPYIVHASYGYPLIKRIGNTLTAGESGLYMDPLRGFGTYYAIMSAKAVTDRILKNPDTELESEMENEILRRYKTRMEILQKLPEKYLEGMISRVSGEKYISMSDEMMKSNL